MIRMLAGALLVFVALAGPAAAAEPLTTPLMTTATQYAVRGVFVNFTAQNVEIRLDLLDSTGAIVRTITTQVTFAEFGLTPARQTTLSGWIVTYMKTQGFIN